MHIVTASEKERLAYLTRNDPSDTVLLLDALKTIQDYNLDAKPEDRIGTPEEIAACFAQFEKFREDTVAATLVALCPNEAASSTPEEPVKHAFITTCQPTGGSSASSAKDVEKGAVLTLPRPVRLHKRKGSKMAPSMLIALDNAPSTTTGQVIRHIQMNAKKRESENIATRDGVESEHRGKSPVKHGRPIRQEDFDWDVSYRYIHFNTPPHKLRGTGLKQSVALDATPELAIKE